MMPRPSAAQAMAIRVQAGTALPPVETVRVLLVDDDREDQLLTREFLSEAEGRRFQLDTANSLQTGLEAIRQQRHDAILVDYRLGTESGLDLLRQAITEGCLVPLIVLTGQGDREVDLEAMRAGAADYLVKSQIDGPLLERSIRYAIERKRHEQERERLIQELTTALAKIKTLRGLVPICSYCKKIRDDRGFWKQVEEYIRDHTEADFTHGLCPDCYEHMMAEIKNSPQGSPLTP